MNIHLSPETQSLLEAQMKQSGHADPDTVVRMALESLNSAQSYEALDADTQAAIERAEAQSARGEGRPWKIVKQELTQRFRKA